MGPFTNVQVAFGYWSGTEYAPNDTNRAWMLSEESPGPQMAGFKATTNAYAWAVRDGDIVPIPEPNTALLLGIGMMGLGMRRRSVHHHHSL